MVGRGGGQKLVTVTVLVTVKTLVTITTLVTVTTLVTANRLITVTTLVFKFRFFTSSTAVHSLRSRRLEVAGERENGRARGRHARGSFSRARFLLCPLLPSACYPG